MSVLSFGVARDPNSQIPQSPDKGNANCAHRVKIKPGESGNENGNRKENRPRNKPPALIPWRRFRDFGGPRGPRKAEVKQFQGA